jgi:hypothetical protein
MSLWSFLRGLWPWRARPKPAPPPRPEPRAAPEPASPEEADPSPPPSEAVPPAPAHVEAGHAEPVVPDETPDEPEDEDGGWEDEDVDDPDSPDPFISNAPIERQPDDADLAERRASARATALSGEQRIYLSMPAGPGSLAEALEQLAAEGLVTAEFVGDDGEPHILYRPQ